MFDDQMSQSAAEHGIRSLTYSYINKFKNLNVINRIHQNNLNNILFFVKVNNLNMFCIICLGT